MNKFYYRGFLTTPIIACILQKYLKTAARRCSTYKIRVLKIFAKLMGKHCLVFFFLKKEIPKLNFITKKLRQRSFL